MNAIVQDPDILGGEPVFRGTRVPFTALFDYLEAGDPLTEFLDDFPQSARNLRLRPLNKREPCSLHI